MAGSGWLYGGGSSSGGGGVTQEQTWFVGASDDLHAALAAATSASGGLVVLGADKIITKPLELGPNVILEAAHPGITVTKPATIKSLLTVNANAGTSTVTVASAVGFSVGKAIHLYDTSSYEWLSTQAIITDITGNVITLDRTIHGNLQTARSAAATTSFPMVINTSMAENIRVRGITFDQAKNASDPTDDFTLAIIHWVEAYSAAVDDCILLNACGDAYSDQGSDLTGATPAANLIKVTNNAFRTSTVRDAGRHATHIGSCMSGAFIEGNEITDCGGMALFYCAYATNSVFRGNIVTNCGLGASGGDDRDTSNIIEANIFTGCGTAGWTIDAGGSTTVASNRLINCTRGVRIQQPDCIIADNDINMTSGNEHLRIEGSADRTRVVGGKLTGGNTSSIGLYVADVDDIKVTGLTINGPYKGASLRGVSNFRAIDCPILATTTGVGWAMESSASTDVDLDLSGTLVATPYSESVAPTRLIINGIADNGAVNPATSGPWNTATGRRYDGTVIRWNDGVEHFSVRRSSGWSELVIPISRSIFKPSAALYETHDRQSSTLNNSGLLASGRPHFIAIGLPAGIVITSITFVTGGTAGASLTNQWFGLFDSSFQALRFTVDDLTAAWAANATKTLALTSTYTTTYTGLHYLCINVTGTTMPTFLCVVDGGEAAAALAPRLNGHSGSGRTSPPALPFNTVSITQTISKPYAYVS